MAILLNIVKKDLYKRPTVQMLLNDNDNAIICLQETWFTKQDLAHLNDLHPGFHGTGVATVDNRDALYHGHPLGEFLFCGEYATTVLLHPLNLV